jgi:hypothetical protein
LRDRFSGLSSRDQLEEALGAKDSGDRLDRDIVVQVLDHSVSSLSTDLEEEILKRRLGVDLDLVKESHDVLLKPFWIVPKLLKPLRRCSAESHHAYGHRALPRVGLTNLDDLSSAPG